MAYRRQRYNSSESDDSSGSDDYRSVRSGSSRNSGRQSAQCNSGRAEVWRCRECCREFATRQGLNCHITVMHERSRPAREEPELEHFNQLSIRNASDRFPCRRCDKDYATQGNLNRHMREFHGAATTSNVNVRKQTNVQNNVKIQNNYFYFAK